MKRVASFSGDGGDMLLRNVDCFPTDYRALCPRRQLFKMALRKEQFEVPVVRPARQVEPCSLQAIQA